ncbi:M14 family metallopeptidase [Fibrobacterota bacterium]
MGVIIRILNSIEVKYTFVKILTGSDLSKRRLPFMMMKGRKKGPVLWLTGCMHGDEIGGTVVIHEIFKRLKKKLLCGAVFSFPLMNSSGFENMSRNISFSREDLNRSFPGDPKGTLAQRIAGKIFNAIIKTSPSLVVDLHNDWNKSIPYVLIDSGVKDQSLRPIEEFTSASGLLKVRDCDILQSSLTFNLIQKNIPAFTMELGESLIINEKNINYGINSIWNILMKFRMVDESEPWFEYGAPERFREGKLKYSAHPLSSSSGIIRFNKKPGESVRKGERVARVYNAFGKAIESITAPEEGIVLGTTDYAVAYPGAQVMAFGVRE